MQKMQLFHMAAPMPCRLFGMVHNQNSPDWLKVIQAHARCSIAV